MAESGALIAPGGLRFHEPGTGAEVPPGRCPGRESWPVAHPVAATLAWSALLAVFVPLWVRTYRRRGR